MLRHVAKGLTAKQIASRLSLSHRTVENHVQATFRKLQIGNRVELANSGARLVLAPDWEPVVWTEADRKKGQAWGLKTIDTFHTHGTPPVKRQGH